MTVGGEPVVERGDDEPGVAMIGAGVMVGAGDDGTGVPLSPPFPIWTEPNGIPVRETVVGDEDDIAAGDDAAPFVLVLHVPDAVALPGNGVPVPIPKPPPSKVVPEPDAPDDGLPTVEHAVPTPVIPIVPVNAGLSPGDASSVAPMGMPTGGTDEPGIVPSGVVGSRLGVGPPPICATTGGQLKRAIIQAAIKVRRIAISFILNRRAAPSTRRQPFRGPALFKITSQVPSRKCILFTTTCLR